MIGFIIGLLVIGIIAGFVARLLVPGPDPMGFVATMVLGIIGSFVGGFLANLIFHGRLSLDTSGIISSIIGAIIVLLIYIRVRGRGARA